MISCVSGSLNNSSSRSEASSLSSSASCQCQSSFLWIKKKRWQDPVLPLIYSSEGKKFFLVVTTNKLIMPLASSSSWSPRITGSPSSFWSSANTLLWEIRLFIFGELIFVGQIWSDKRLWCLWDRPHHLIVVLLSLRKFLFKRIAHKHKVC